VRAIVRPGSGRALPHGVERVEAALEPDALARAADGAEVLVHGAAVARAGHDSAYAGTNVGGTRAAALAATAAGARLLVISSQAAAGPGTPLSPRHEDDQPNPLTGYGRSKLAAEEEVRTHARVPWTIVRPVSIYGPRDRQFLPLFRMASRGFFPLAANPDAVFSLIHVSDAVRGIRLALAEEAHGDTMFLAHPVAVGSRDLLAILAGAFNRPFRPVPVPRSVLRVLAGAGDVAWKLGRTPVFDTARLTELSGEGFVCSVDRAHQRIGFRADVALSDGVERTARWYREQGWL
jgi:nucleoside-diphosphate-sugar epimerase